jgi:hypothetical protein
MEKPAPRCAMRSGCRNFPNVRNPPNVKSASPDFASLLNIAHLHFRFARQVGERDSQLGATITPHAAEAGAIDPDILRQRWPDHARGDVAKGGTAHVLFIRVERLVSNEASSTMIGEYA